MPRHPPYTLSSLITFIDHRRIRLAPPWVLSYPSHRLPLRRAHAVNSMGFPAGELDGVRKTRSENKLDLARRTRSITSIIRQKGARRHRPAPFQSTERQGRGFSSSWGLGSPNKHYMDLGTGIAEDIPEGHYPLFRMTFLNL